MNISACQKCFNCGLCYNICPHQAITVDKTETFYRPAVDTQKCTDCGLCYNRCPANNVLCAKDPIAAYAGWHKDPTILSSSSSGGVFHGLARSVMEQGGVVFGAVYSEDCMEVIFASTEEDNLALMQKSKYVESLVGTTFRKIKDFLAQGRKVLFCGTPCQCAGLHSFLGRDYENLITCDFACGGLPSHQIYQAYLSGLQRKYGTEVRSIDFRPKTHGWRRHAVLVRFANGKVYNRLGTEDPYLRSFLYGKYTIRDGCLDCKFSDCHQSDITIADFWLNEKYSSLVNPDGISLILCNTEQGRQAVGQIRRDYHFEELAPAQVAYNNKKTVTPAKAREQHDAFIRLYRERGFDRAYRQFFPFSWKETLRSRLGRLVRRHIR